MLPAASLREAEATVGLAAKAMGHTSLTAPADGIVMTRVVEPGTVVLPTAWPIYSMAITGEVWVRALCAGAAADPGRAGHRRHASDPDHGRIYHGRVGDVSPTAEFTPKTVETPELRTELVYRLRDPGRGPRRRSAPGQPVTIHIPPQREQSDGRGAGRRGCVTPSRAARCARPRRVRRHLGDDPARHDHRPRRPGRRGQDHAAAPAGRPAAAGGGTCHGAGMTWHRRRRAHAGSATCRSASASTRI